jgi:hypothetical protein
VAAVKHSLGIGRCLLPSGSLPTLRNRGKLSTSLALDWTAGVSVI